MKIFVVGMVATMLISGCVLAQEKPEASKTETSAPKPLLVSGRVSDAGRTLTTDIDSEWTVSNPDALKGRDGRLVKVKCYVDTEKNRIQILSVKKDDAQSNYTAARYTDSAFRR